MLVQCILHVHFVHTHTHTHTHTLIPFEDHKPMGLKADIAGSLTGVKALTLFSWGKEGAWVGGNGVNPEARKESTNMTYISVALPEAHFVVLFIKVVCMVILQKPRTLTQNEKQLNVFYYETEGSIFGNTLQISFFGCHNNCKLKFLCYSLN